MSIESTVRVMRRYWDSGLTDISMMANDVIFTMMADGSETKGPEAVLHSLNRFYRIAFDANPEIFNEVIGDGRAVAEGYYTGTHIGDFAGIPATGKEVRVPLCVSYELENDQITRARIYLEMPILMAQLGMGAAGAGG